MRTGEALSPTDEAELAEAVRAADGPLRIVGGGTRDIGRPVDGQVLSVAGLSGVTLYEPGALTLVVRAGTPLAEIEALLAGQNQRLPFEPMDHRGLLGTKGAPTIGGAIAANVSGPRRVQVGAARDFVLGARFVDGSGTVISNGGRVMKNVTGTDLARLICGAHGTLGVLTEVSLKVLPDVSFAADLTFEGLDDGAAVAAMSDALGTPFEVTGAAHDALAGTTRLRLEGAEASVRYRAGALAQRLSRYGAARTCDNCAARWAAIRDAAPFHGTDDDVWRVHARPSAAAGLVARADARRTLYDWGGGLIWIGCAPGTDLRARLGDFDGHATLVRAGEGTRRAIPPFAPPSTPIAGLSAGLRARFDPRGILNPGLME